MEHIQDADDFRTAVRDWRNVTYVFDDSDDHPAKLWQQEGGLYVTLPVTVEPTRPERYGEAIDKVRDVFGEDIDVTVEYDRTEHIPGSHTVDHYKVDSLVAEDGLQVVHETDETDENSARVEFDDSVVTVTHEPGDITVSTRLSATEDDA